MSDINFGPLILGVFLILIVIPAIVGFFVGIIACSIYYRKKLIPKTNRTFGILFSGFVLAVLFPLATITFFNWQNNFEEGRFQTKQKQYVQQNLANFKIKNISLVNNIFRLDVEVPRTGKYYLYVYLIQDDQQIVILNNNQVKFNLTNGSNSLEINVYNNKYPLPASPKLAVKIQNTDDSYALRNTRKALVVSNPGSIVKKEGIIYYPSDLATNNQTCAMVNFTNYLPCVPNELLNIINK